MRPNQMIPVVSGLARTVAIVLLVAAGLQGQTSTPAVPAGSVDSGKRLFTAYYCYACHGTQGQGSTAGARLAPRPIAFAAFQKYLRQPTGQMPPYKGTVVTDQDVADLYAFLRSIPPAASAKTIPLLQQ